MNQTINQEQIQTINNPFDPSTLSAEALAWVDRQRTQASQTARANARKDLLKDEKFLNEVRSNMQPQVQQTVEQQMQAQMSAMSKRLSTSEVSRILTNGGIPNNQLDAYVEMFASEDIDSSIQRATNFVSTFNTTLQSMRDVQQQQAIQNMTTPHTSSVSVSEQQTLQSRLDEARKNTTFKGRDVFISSILREASEKGIILK